MTTPKPTRPKARKPRPLLDDEGGTIASCRKCFGRTAYVWVSPVESAWSGKFLDDLILWMKEARKWIKWAESKERK